MVDSIFFGCDCQPNCVKVTFDSMTTGGTNCEYMNDYTICWNEAKGRYYGVFSWPDCGGGFSYRRVVEYFCDGTLKLSVEFFLDGVGWITFETRTNENTIRNSCNPFEAETENNVTRQGCCTMPGTLDLQKAYVRGV